MIKQKIKDAIQKQLGNLVENLTEDILIKSFGKLNVEIGDCEILPPKIQVKSDGFKIKIIDKSTGDAISDIPIPIDISVELPIIKVMKKQLMEIVPKIDIKINTKE